MLSPASSVHRGPNELYTGGSQGSVLGVQSATKSLKPLSADIGIPGVNPFKLPDDSNIFLLRNKEKERRKMELQSQLGLRVHEKVTYAGRVKAQQAALRKELREGWEEEEEKSPRPGAEGSLLAQVQKHPAWKVHMIKDRNIEKESMHEFIAKKRQMFLLEYSVVVKCGEMEKLEEVAAAEERKLWQAEKFLMEDAVLFDEFLKENDKNSVEAIKIAEQETKVKLEKAAEIKRITTKMVTIKSEISNFEDLLKEYTLYEKFLFKLSPPEWQEKQRAKTKSLKAQSATKTESPKAQSATKTKDVSKDKEKDKDRKTGHADRRSAESRKSIVGRELPPVRGGRASVSKASVKPTTPSGKSSPGTDMDSSEYEDPELYFTEPRQLLDLLTELEEQNLSLIQNSHETEESLEEFRQVMEQVRKQMEQDTEQLNQQIDIMTHTIQREGERSAELELMARLFNFGKFKADDQEGLLDSLSRKVEEVYRGCVGDSESNLSTLQMLTAIEGRLGDLLERVEMIPTEHLLLAERAKEKERRLRLRDDKIHQQKQHQEERLKRALDRAQAEIKKTTGRKLMARSEPPTRKLKTSQVDNITDQEKEEQLYFFM